ncbi:MAG: hypothetical protein KJ737_25710 [Proteobacteria bacterium]|nr:hypothetical protein [Pseudomonadota bacterium]
MNYTKKKRHHGFLVKISVMGQVVEYGNAQLNELRGLISEMKSSTGEKRRFILTTTT